MQCWICCHGAQTNAEEVGTCIICHIFACDDHGDRPTKARFWCFVCLQRVALNTAGFPDLTTLAGVDADPIEELSPALTHAELLTLRSRLELAEPRYDVVGAPIAESAFELARALAERSAGSLELDHLREDFRRYDVIDPRLVESMGLR